MVGKGAKRSKSKRKKKVGKHEPRADKESEAEKAKANAAIWEARLKMAELSRTQYRDAARTLAHNNEELSKNQYQMEKDMLEVIGFLKKQDLKKDEMIEELQRQLSAERKQADEERQQLIEAYKKQIASLEEKCSQKTQEMQIIQAEFRMMKEFRRRKGEMEKELDEIKGSLRRANQEHKESLAAIERRFFQDKQRLEKEAEKKIVMLAEKAHNEAIMQLDDAGRSVFKENVRLKEAISYHLDEARNLKKANTQLKEEKERLLQEKETSEKLVQEKVLQVSHKNTQIQELQRTVQTMGCSVEEMRMEIEDGMQKKHLQIQGANQAGSAELQKLQRLLESKDREMNRVKKLAHNILQERTEVEHFFLEALEQVKQEIKSNRNYYQKMAQVAYNSRMMQAAAGTEQYPKIRTFHNKEHSTNDVSQDVKEAEKWSHIESGKVDIADLTWEQKEKVLRLLFAKMNASVPRKKGTGVKAVMFSGTRDPQPRETAEISDNTIFITQQVPEQSTSSGLLPDIYAAKCHPVA
ncbi:basal body-orientation factor 1 [Rana temporaria]|uniref:basal body-orientation factor 1 n=1 Tax=Rana temporaria TaxID=8407 RepID=UPI001AAD280D|nr:basal body-orientation factor 1 [Rana temporaria]